ncbi:MAG: formimidoylglutamase [Chitinophagales bacterium]|nr:formimidoylglutamase [Chitinophagales bacterium]MDW8418864.1 formimidoylglutamase [Chitinophagales bacterium]
MIQEFLTPIAKEGLLQGDELHPGQIGNYMYIYEGKPVELSTFNLALIGVGDDRGNPGNPGSAKAPDIIRKEFYKLYVPPIEREFKMIDLGNIRPGETLRDTYVALAGVMTELITHKVVPIVLGGSNDVAFGQYLGYKGLMTLVNVVNVDERIDMVDFGGDHSPEASSFLMKILTHSPNYLYHYAHLGHQTYLNDTKLVETLQSLNFDCHRLGVIRENMNDAEPILRDADMLMVDISAVRMADAPAHAQATPNGFTGEELCLLMRYAGLSDKLSSLGIYEINPNYDHNRQTTQLAAQMIWCFVEGYYNRVGDYPVTQHDHLKFTVRIEEANHNLVFWRSKKTDRWWMEVPVSKNERFTRSNLVPCSIRDYETACSQELPDRWMKAYTKMM